MRKFWFAYLAKALVVFPGGFGTMDELFEILTLAQTKKLAKKMPIVLYGSSFWKEIINFDALVKYGTISPEDLQLFEFVDDPDAAMTCLKRHLSEQSSEPEQELPPFQRPPSRKTKRLDLLASLNRPSRAFMVVYDLHTARAMRASKEICRK